MKDLKRKNPLLVFGYNAKQNHWKGRRLCRSDTGITQHPDLVGRIVGWKDCVQGRKPYVMTNGHGTHGRNSCRKWKKRKRSV